MTNKWKCKLKYKNDCQYQDTRIANTRSDNCKVCYGSLNIYLSHFVVFLVSAFQRMFVRRCQSRSQLRSAESCPGRLVSCSRGRHPMRGVSWSPGRSAPLSRRWCPSPSARMSLSPCVKKLLQIRRKTQEINRFVLPLPLTSVPTEEWGRMRRCI